MDRRRRATLERSLRQHPTARLAFNPGQRLRSHGAAQPQMQLVTDTKAVRHLVINDSATRAREPLLAVTADARASGASSTKRSLSA